MQSNFIFVLVRPVYLGNIGSVARVLKNFGFQQLRLVDPPRNYKDSEARRMSTDAFDLLKEAQVFSSLTGAIQDVCLAVGTTAGQYRDETPIPFAQLLPQVLQIASANKVALVFGNERNGLMREELKSCHQIATIVTNPECPSLNVSQAVGIVAYEISRSNHLPLQLPSQHPTVAMDDELFAQIESLLTSIEFTRKFNHMLIVNELRSLYQRILPNKRESDVLTGLIRKINQNINRMG